MNYGADVVAQALDELGVDIAGVSRNGWGQALCPLHEDSSPSFTVHMEEGGWKCYSGCGSSSDLADLVVAVTGRDARDVRRQLQRQMGVDHESLMRVLDGPEPTDPRKPDPLFYEVGRVPRYMLRRGFTLETCRVWGVGWDSFDQAVVLPLRPYGKLEGLVQRRLFKGPKYYNIGFHTGDLLFGWEHLREDADEVVVHEGPLDAMWLWQHGYSAVATLGVSLSDVQADLLRGRVRKVYSGADADESGAKLRSALREKLGGLDLWELAWPQGKKDAQECSEDELRGVFTAAREMWYN